jgi:hypothetical protein
MANGVRQMPNPRRTQPYNLRQFLNDVRVKALPSLSRIIEIKLGSLDEAPLNRAGFAGGNFV